MLLNQFEHGYTLSISRTQEHGQLEPQGGQHCPFCTTDLLGIHRYGTTSVQWRILSAYCGQICVCLGTSGNTSFQMELTRLLSLWSFLLARRRPRPLFPSECWVPSHTFSSPGSWQRMKGGKEEETLLTSLNHVLKGRDYMRGPDSSGV